MLVDKIPVLTKDLTNNYFYIVLLIKALILIFPSNFLVKLIMPKYDQKKEKEEVKNGKMIGVLERLLMLTFLYLNQVTAIGLVLTCKSITRFKQLEDKKFAERYLIGTMLSTLITIIVYAL